MCVGKEKIQGEFFAGLDADMTQPNVVLANILFLFENQSNNKMV